MEVFIKLKCICLWIGTTYFTFFFLLEVFRKRFVRRDILFLCAVWSFLLL